MSSRAIWRSITTAGLIHGKSCFYPSVSLSFCVNRIKWCLMGDEWGKSAVRGVVPVLVAWIQGQGL